VARLRERRKQGEVHFSGTLSAYEISGLIAGAWLDPARRSDAAAVAAAFCRFVEYTLDQRRYPRPGRYG
jgi:hypothetical protein